MIYTYTSIHVASERSHLITNANDQAYHSVYETKYQTKTKVIDNLRWSADSESIYSGFSRGSVVRPFF